MLTSLLVQNVALMDQLRVDWDAGLTVITGETGAGKSILIDALSLALGERADTTMIRDGAQKAVVEAEFDVQRLAHLQETVTTLGAEWQQVLILRREISSKGVSRCFVNDTPVNVSDLKRIGDVLVDIHGQHEHQSLLRAETHRSILDGYGNVGPVLEEYRYRYETFHELLSELQQAREARDGIEERRFVLEQRLRELNAIDPKLGEDARIEKELKVAEHVERVAAAGHEILERLYDADGNVMDQLGRCAKLLAELQNIDTAFTQQAGEIETASAIVSEVARFLRRYVEALEVSPEQCESLRRRLADLVMLKRKYSVTLDEVVEQHGRMQSEYDSLDSLDERIAALELKLEKTREFVASQAMKLTRVRQKTAVVLGQRVVAELGDLGIKDARFETRVTASPAVAKDQDFLEVNGERLKAGPDGVDTVEFYLSTNLGEEPKPLAKVASGGEVSRIMLALKSCFAGKSVVPVMVFDEIDVGVSGNIAVKVGAVMKRLAQQHQIIAITHLPQIAGAGDRHMLVEKLVDGNRTITRLRALDMEERTHEVARLVSGDEITEASLQNAMELLHNG